MRIEHDGACEGRTRCLARAPSESASEHGPHRRSYRCVWFRNRLWSQSPSAQTRSLSHGAALGKLLKLPKIQFAHSWSGNDHSTAVSAQTCPSLGCTRAPWRVLLSPLSSVPPHKKNVVPSGHFWPKHLDFGSEKRTASTYRHRGFSLRMPRGGQQEGDPDNSSAASLVSQMLRG